MKKSLEIAAHIFFWSMFTILTLVLSKMYLEAVPTAPFAQHLNYVVFLELAMGLIFFYTTFFGILWAQRKRNNSIILTAILVVLLLTFAFPATHFGTLQVLSSLIPHLLLIFLAILFYRSFKVV